MYYKFLYFLLVYELIVRDNNVEGIFQMLRDSETLDFYLKYLFIYIMKDKITKLKRVDWCSIALFIKPIHFKYVYMLKNPRYEGMSHRRIARSACVWYFGRSFCKQLTHGEITFDQMISKVNEIEESKEVKKKDFMERRSLYI